MAEKYSVFSGKIVAFDLESCIGTVEWLDGSGDTHRRKFFSGSVDCGWARPRYVKVGEKAEVLIRNNNEGLLRVRIGKGIRD